ncbi:low-density lipoprotein receptor domain-containing jelly belly protein [Calliopsis andreniformis]|uniref:low-density lipoprotein receptor domain-containing jelly belly protein n=1 Tax=Calliopsis andreniformis TaxID=337506 RepID=UPI003FCE3312
MMAVCMFWLLTYVGQGLDLAVGNRPVIIMQGAQEQDYRHGNTIRKKSELSSVGNNLLHFRIYPPEASQRDDLSNWLLLNDEPPISSWTPAGILIDDMIREPRELETVFFALSPTMLNLLYSEYATSAQSTDQFPHEDQPSHIGQRSGKKLRIDCRHSKRNTLSLPIKVCDDQAGRKALHKETRQSNYDDLFEQKLNSAAHLKTDLTRNEKPREYQTHPGYMPRPIPLEAGKLPAKRNHMPIGRRSVVLPGESAPHQAQPPSSHGAGISVASQLMLRTTRGSIQYDVPQIECPISEDGMERFACPTADRMGRYHCIDDHALCDGFIDCPTGEDEDRQACMFYKTTKAHLDVLADAILRWARGR